MFRNHFKSIDSSFGPLYIDLISREQFGISSTLINQRVTCVFFVGAFGGQKADSRSFRGCIAVLGQGVIPWTMVTYGHAVIK